MANLRNGEIIEGQVSDFGSNGEGIIKVGAYPIFVPFAIKGETVRIKITLTKKDYAFGKLINVLSASKERIKPPCPYYGKCGGCDLQHISRDMQQQLKCDSVRVAFKKNAQLDVAVPLPIRLNDWKYRNKIALPFGYNARSNRVNLGFYEKMSHSVVPMKWCALHDDWASKLILSVSEWANENNVSVYDEKKRDGLLRHLVARMLNTLSVTLVINGEEVPKLNALVEKLRVSFADFAIYISTNKANTNVIMGETAKLVYGIEKPQNLGKFSAKVSPLSFLQVNNTIRDAIYDAVCNNLSDFDGDIIELYSGVGLLSAQIAARLKNAHITAVEIVPSASENANALMQSLGFENRITNICEDAVNFVKKLSANVKDNGIVQNNCNVSNVKNSKIFDKSKFDEKVSDMNFDSLMKSEINAKIDNENRLLTDKNLLNSKFNLGTLNNLPIPIATKKALILDPPRKGCDAEVLKTALDAEFERIIYVSCNPQTLARDVKLLLPKYEIVSVQPYDMFPQTSHIETLVLLCRK